MTAVKRLVVRNMRLFEFFIRNPFYLFKRPAACTDRVFSAEIRSGSYPQFSPGCARNLQFILGCCNFAVGFEGELTGEPDSLLSYCEP